MNKALVNVRIVVVDPRPVYRDAFGALLASQPGITVAGLLGDWTTVPNQVSRLRPDVLLFELDPAHNEWLEALAQLDKFETRTSVIALTDDVDQDCVVRGIERGIRGMVPKDTTTELLVKSIRCVMSGEYWIGRERIADVIDFLRRRKKEDSAAAHTFGLTERERDVVQALLAGASNKEIAEQLSISNQAVRHHLSRTFEKLGVSNRLQLAILMLQRVITDPKELSQGTRCTAR